MNNSQLIKQTGLTLLQGKSGLGKTTFLLKLYKELVENNENVIFVTQEPTLFTNERVGNYIKKITNNEIIEADLNNILKKFELFNEKNIRVKNLSGGQQQRLQIMLAYIQKPNFLLLDEPTSFQDRTNANSLMKIMQEYSEDNFVLIVSHDEGTFNFFKQKVTLENGEIVFIEKFEFSDLSTTKIKKKHQKKMFYLFTWKNYIARNILASFMIAIIGFFSLMIFYNVFSMFFATINTILNEPEIYSTLATTAYDIDYANTSTTYGASFYQIPNDGEQEYYYSQEQIEEFAQLPYIHDLQVTSEYIKPPSVQNLSTGETGSCVQDASKDEYDELMVTYNLPEYSDSIIYFSYGCTFISSYGSSMSDVIYGNNKVTKNTNEVIIPIWLALEYNENPEELIGEQISLDLFTLQADGTYQEETYEFKVVGINNSWSNFVIYDYHTFAAANNNYVIADQLEYTINNYLRLAAPTEEEMLMFEPYAYMTGEEIYNEIGLGITALGFYVDNGPSWYAYIDYAYENFQGSVIQDVEYKARNSFQQFLNTTKTVAIFLVITISIAIIVSWGINKATKIKEQKRNEIIYYNGNKKKDAIKIAKFTNNVNNLFIFVCTTTIFLLLLYPIAFITSGGLIGSIGNWIITTIKTIDLSNFTTISNILLLMIAASIMLLVYILIIPRGVKRAFKKIK